MRSLITALAVTLLMAGPAAADTLRFAWDYDAAAQAIIEGFRLYQDGQPLEIVIPPAARTVDTPYLKDRQARTYHLTAFDGMEESGPSDMATVPAFFANIPRVIQGTFRFEIIED
jgi:hypothetical protein